ncbi:hypothetical protein L1987_66200 [Smallanthus sonchifolius]|uniref:Uncharacterized protein n=1 Tax=Smallanthus sonchifolius TaxID=185202 RepID=A0ACB9BWM3_9ASTR|nr:hypothetical protein L1987_66200 [Smallanthus sonchifolius]
MSPGQSPFDEDSGVIRPWKTNPRIFWKGVMIIETLMLSESIGKREEIEIDLKGLEELWKIVMIIIESCFIRESIA